MKFKNKLFLFITAIEIILALCFAKYFYDKKTNAKKVLGAMKVAVLDKEKIDVIPQEDLQYFYEYKPNEYLEDNPGWLSQKVVYKINADGLNERFDYDVEKNPGVFRILTLGDSFTFGHNVNTENNWTERLEDKLNKEIKNNKINKFEVINLGMPGYDVQYIVRRYRMRGLKYNPDLILWFEGGFGSVRFRELMGQIIHDCEAKLSEESEKDNIAKYCWAKASDNVKKQYSEEEIYGLLEIYWKEFLALKKETKFIYFGYFSDKYKLFINSLLDNCKNCYLYNGPDISDGGILADGHPSAKGHKIIAEDIFDYLVKNNLVR